MLFNSYSFLLCFLPISIIGYYALGRYAAPAAAKLWLATASFVFYGWWNPLFVVLLLISIAANYALSVFIIDTAERPGLQRALLVIGITLNLGVLVYYKYLFAVLGFLHLHGWLATDFGLITLPLGISFFTFTQIGFLVDCQQDMVKDKNLLNYVLFVTFFPHLIAGPILHHREIMPQFADDSTYRANTRMLAVGLTLFAFGLAKKVLLADSIAPWAEAGFAHPAELGALTAWSTALAYSMQLYFDFSGYSDMAVGLGAMFGVRLPLNFNSPYKAASIIDFWQRWHMTLTRYLTLLLYNPVSLWITRRRSSRGRATNRRATQTFEGFASMVAFPTFFTMTLAGVWHGAGLQFVLWGVLHASYLTLNHAWRIFGPKNTLGAANASATGARAAGTAAAGARAAGALAVAFGRTWRVLLTYAAVLLAQVFFRAASVTDAWTLIANGFGRHGSDIPLSVAGFRLMRLGAVGDFLYRHGILVVSASHELWDSVTRPLLHNSTVVAGLMVIAWFAPNSIQLLGDWSPALQKIPPTPWRLARWNPNVAWAVGLGVCMYYVLTRLDQPGRFLYFQF